MKASTPALRNLLATGQFVSADLWTITLYGGVVVRWSAADVPITANGQTFVRGPALNKGSISEKRGLEVPTLQGTIIAGDTDLINGTPIIPFIKGRGLDGALFRVDRAFMADWGQPVVGTILRHSGRITSIDQVGGSEAQFTSSGWTILLNVNMPTNLFQAGCLHTVYDQGCGLDPNNFKASGVVASLPAPTQTVFGTSVSGPDVYSQGKIKFSTGANAGIPRAVKSFDGGGIFTLIAPLPTAPSPGDQFDVFQGCDNTLATCRNRFNNAGPGLPRRFKATPYVPLPETAIG